MMENSTLHSVLGTKKELVPESRMPICSSGYSPGISQNVSGWISGTCESAFPQGSKSIDSSYIGSLSV